MGNTCQPIQQDCGSSCKPGDNMELINEQTIDVEKETQSVEIEFDTYDTTIVPIQVTKKSQQQFSIQKIKQENQDKQVLVKNIGVIIHKGKYNKIENMVYSNQFKGSKSKFTLILEEGDYFMVIKFIIEVTDAPEFNYEKQQSSQNNLKGIASAFQLSPQKNNIIKKDQDSNKINTDKQETQVTHNNEESQNQLTKEKEEINANKSNSVGNKQNQNSQSTIVAKAETIKNARENSKNKCSIDNLSKADGQIKEENEEEDNSYKFTVKLSQFPKFSMNIKQNRQENTQFYNALKYAPYIFKENIQTVKNFQQVAMLNNSNVIIPFQINGNSKYRINFVFIPKDGTNKVEYLNYFLFEGVVDKKKEKTLGKLLTKQKEDQNWFNLEYELSEGFYTILVKLNYPIQRNLIKTDYELFIFTEQTVVTIDKSLMKPYHNFGGY